jgi:hypothetical protein
MHPNLEGIEAWMLPGSLRIRNAISKAEFVSMGSRTDFLSLCDNLFAATEDGFFSDTDLQQLRNLGLVTAPPCDPCLDGDAGALLRLRCGTTYWNYGDAMALQRDAADMRRFQEQDPPREIFEEKEVCLNLATASDGLRMLATLAHQVFDSRGSEHFHHELVEKKLIPSIGARHGLGAYLYGRFNGFEGAQWVRVKTDGTHMAIRSSKSTSVSQEDACDEHMLICVNFERYQWRYRSAWVYQCVYLDLGHALAALKLLAHRQGCSLTFKHARCDAMDAKRALENEPLIRVAIL